MYYPIIVWLHRNGSHLIIVIIFLMSFTHGNQIMHQILLLMKLIIVLNIQNMQLQLLLVQFARLLLLPSSPLLVAPLELPIHELMPFASNILHISSKSQRIFHLYHIHNLDNIRIYHIILVSRLKLI